MSARPEASDARSATKLRQQLRRVVDEEALSIVFQPIVDLRSARVIGHEVLTRPGSETGFDGPAEMFEQAEEFGMLEDIERLARRRAFEAVAREGHDSLIFLNNSPPVFTSDRFIETIASEIEYFDDIECSRVVLEVTERTSPNLIDDLDVRALLLREMGFQVAIDDVGAGVNGLNQIMSLRPNWIKLDRIDYDPLKQKLMRTFVRFSRFSNIGLIAEGVERVEELSTLIDLGVTHAQGFFLARPTSTPEQLNAELSQFILDLQQQASDRTHEDVSSLRLESITVPAPVYERSTPVGEVIAAMEQQVHHAGIILLDGKRYLGWVDRSTLDEYIARAQPDDAIGGCAISENPVAAHDAVLGEALEIAASRSDANMTQPVVVQRDGEIVGIVTHRQLLRAAARVHQRQSHMDPLTGMPSRLNADLWLSERIRAGDPVNVAVIDLRDFDSYNVAYGPEMGDAMLLRLASLIKRIAGDHGESVQFMAHLGGDRFMIACTQDAMPMLNELQQAFEAQRNEFFSAVDVAADAYRVVGPSGRERTIPLITLRIVYLEQPLLRVADTRELHAMVSQLRLSAPASEQSTMPIIMDRRSTTVAHRASA